MGSTAYLNKKGESIYRSELEERKEDQDYWLLHETEVNDSMKIQAIFDGVIVGAKTKPREKWTPLVLKIIHTITEDSVGEKLAEPKQIVDELASGRYIDLAALEKAYNEERDMHDLPPVELTMGKDDPAPPEPEDDDDDYDDEEIADIDEDDEEEQPEEDPIETVSAEPTFSDDDDESW